MRAIALTAALLAPLALTGCGSDPKLITLGGTLTINAEGVETAFVWGEPGRYDCHGTGGYDDVKAGTQVTVKDAAGKVVGVGQLGQGTATIGWMGGEQTATQCTFPLKVNNVPAGDFYEVQVGGRKPIAVTAAQVDAGLKLTLG